MNIRPLTVKEALFVHTLVARMFATFHNSKMTGPNFSWDRFGVMMMDQTALQYPLACRRKPSNDTCYVVGYWAKLFAESLVKTMKADFELGSNA